MDTKIIDSLKELIKKIEENEVGLISFEVVNYTEDNTSRVELTVQK